MAQEPAGFVPDGFVPDAPVAVAPSSFPSVEESRRQSHELPQFKRDLGPLEPYRPLIEMALTGMLMGPLVGAAWKTMRGIGAAATAAKTAAASDATIEAVGLISPRAAHALKIAGRMLGKGATATGPAPAEATVAEGPLTQVAQSLATRTGTGMQPSVPMPTGPIRTAPAPPAAASTAAPAPVRPPPAATEPPWRQSPPENAQAIRDAIARNRGGTSAGPSPAAPGASSGPGEAVPASPQVVDMPQGPPVKASQAQAVVKAAARAAGIKLTPGEARDVMHLVEAGHDAETVITLVPRARAELAAAELARRLGTPTDAQVAASKPWNRAGMAQPEP